MKMKIHTILITLLWGIGLTSVAQNSAPQAKKVLDKTAGIVGKKSGTSANFSIAFPNSSKASGTISIKGNKFKAKTSEAIVWYNGKTQWSYMADTDEVNVTTPNKEEQNTMNPYTFINLYRTGYDLSMVTKGSNYVVTLQAQKKQPVQQMVITINRSTSIPSQIKMLQSQGWTTINISNFQSKNLADGLFNFNQKECPTAEIIDLR